MCFILRDAILLSHMHLSVPNNYFQLVETWKYFNDCRRSRCIPGENTQALIGRTINSASIHEECGCNVIGISANGLIMIDPDLEMILPADGEMILIGSVESEEKFFRLYRPKE